MEERQVSVDGIPRPLPDPFLVAATQNPVEYEGTYPLPEAQLDRFLLKLTMPIPERDAEIDVVTRHAAGFDPRDLDAAGLRPVTDIAALNDARRSMNAVTVAPEIAGIRRRPGQGHTRPCLGAAGGLSARQHGTARDRPRLGLAQRSATSSLPTT